MKLWPVFVSAVAATVWVSVLSPMKSENNVHIIAPVTTNNPVKDVIPPIENRFVRAVASLRGRQLDDSCFEPLQSWMRDAEEKRAKGESPRENTVVKECLGGNYANIQLKESARTIQPGPSLTSAFVGDSGYITWDVFKPEGEGRDGTAREFAEAIKGRNIRYLILDLRLNSGGDSKTARDIIDYFAPRDGIATVTFVSATGEGIDEYRTLANPLSKSLQDTFIVIMTSEKTCSASEILAGVLRSMLPNRVVLVGEKTCGKNVYQSVQYVGEYMVSVHGGEWFIGHGEYKRSVKGGLEPDWVTSDVWKVTNALFTLRKELYVKAIQRQLSSAIIVPKKVNTVKCRPLTAGSRDKICQ